MVGGSITWDATVITETPAGNLWLSIATGSITWDAAVITKTLAGKWLSIAAGGITSELQQAKRLGIATGGIPWDAAVITKTPAGKWLSIAAGGITSKLWQAKDSALPLAALLQNSSRQKTRHCHWRHYFKTPAGKRLGIATGGIPWDAAVITKTPAGKWLSIAAGGMTSKLQQAKDSALPLVASLEMLLWWLTLRQATDSALPLAASLEMLLWLLKLWQANSHWQQHHPGKMTAEFLHTIVLVITMPPVWMLSFCMLEFW
jgi:hypothetical protein